jgi:hypothetical protein
MSEAFAESGACGAAYLPFVHTPLRGGGLDHAGAPPPRYGTSAGSSTAHSHDPSDWRRAISKVTHRWSA